MFLGDKVYELGGYNKDDYTTYPSGLPMTVRIDVASELGVPISDVFGKSVKVTWPDGSFSHVTVDAYGFIEFEANSSGKYALDYGSFSNGSNSVLTVPEGCDV